MEIVGCDDGQTRNNFPISIVAEERELSGCSIPDRSRAADVFNESAAYR